MSNRVWIILVLIVICCGNAWSLRVPFPPTMSDPIDEGQISQLNRYLKNIWDMQNGRFELDVVTTTKTNAKNGEIWILNTAGSYSLQVKAGGAVRSVALAP